MVLLAAAALQDASPLHVDGGKLFVVVQLPNILLRELLRLHDLLGAYPAGVFEAFLGLIQLPLVEVCASEVEIELVGRFEEGLIVTHKPHRLLTATPGDVRSKRVHQTAGLLLVFLVKLLIHLRASFVVAHAVSDLRLELLVPRNVAGVVLFQGVEGLRELVEAVLAVGLFEAEGILGAAELVTHLQRVRPTRQVQQREDFATPSDSAIRPHFQRLVAERQSLVELLSFEIPPNC
mmetsp:Transcript_18099/g.51557  ORF Transcript_18099/g.51557 Transcript_18099/m.51557 type:complete len:235 (+) Transcript_18099:1359-2063(+)